MLIEAGFPPSLLRVAPQFERLLRARCEAIISGARAGRSSSPAGEWLLGNYSYLRSQIREIRESLPRNYYRRLPRNDGGNPRLYTAAEQLATQHAENLNAETLAAFFEAWQEHTVLQLSELWAIRPMLKIALLKGLASKLSAAPLEAPETEAAVRCAITGLRSLDEVLWPPFVEGLYVPDRILRNDPAGAYGQMDFETRDQYRRSVETLARHAPRTEQEIASIAVDLAAKAGDRHVGEYLIGDGVAELRRAAHGRRTLALTVRDAATAVPALVYIGGAVAFLAAILLAVNAIAGPFPWWFLACLAIPASHAALAIVNLLVSYFLAPRAQPRMDFRNGIPDESRAVVVVPTLLLAKSGIQRLIDNLEIYYLANRDRNLFFALLTDLKDSLEKNEEGRELVEHCAAGIRELNRRYGVNASEPFFLFHREKQWNESEGKWMGRERKRGKLDDFNSFLLGQENRFALTVGDLQQLAGARYVITLDSDTQLPRDTAWKLVGTMAHPLNRPVLDQTSGIVRAGYALMQPRIGVSMESAGKSRFAAIYSGQTGFDPYTTAVSDVYQDLFGRATFTGKGIYDVEVFDRATRGRFPDNTLLSHDLIEGEHVRAGLVTDLEMIDDYPSRYQAFSKRKHRWVRGDWQIAMWLLPRVPDAEWRWKANPLPLVSRWKIFDNLRRSLVELSYLFAFLCAWLVLESPTTAATAAIAGILLVPIYAEVIISLFRPPPFRFLRPWAWARLSAFLRSHGEALLTLLFLPAQALLMADAIIRTLHRRLISHRHLLEWESMAEAEMSNEPKWSLSDLFSPRAFGRVLKSWNLPERYLAIAVILAIVFWVVLLTMSGSTDPLAFTLVLMWAAAPALMMWLNSAPETANQTAEETRFLRGVALSTWRYFLDHETAEDHWLVPDNIQEDPPAVAHRTSPTNIGLQLNAHIAAYEFGYLTQAEVADGVGRVQATLQALDRDREHFFNWYNTQTMEPLPPRFLSTVDSGNLAASLIVTRQGCLAILGQPVARRSILDGLQDHLGRLMDSLPAAARTTAIQRLGENLSRQLASEPDDLFFWEGVLTEILGLAEKLSVATLVAAVRLESRTPDASREIRYWADALLARVKRNLADLIGMAPWLRQPFETELRVALRNPQLAALREKLRAVPKLGELGALYDAIEAELQGMEPGSAGIHQSTLDTLTHLRASIQGVREQWRKLVGALQAEADRAAGFLQPMDFRFLLDERRKLLRIGWNAETGTLADSSYDLLASEARTSVFVAIARGDAPREAWFHLGRKLTYYRGHRTLLSWSGTMFEYLMPALFMQTWPGTLLGESLASVVRIQRLYARERRVPWGISESAHAGRDGALNYQYRAFGVPCCGLDRILPDDLVIAPYATVLSLMVDPQAAIENLQHMRARGWFGRYGFYEAIDFRRQRRPNRRFEIIRAFMAHHQGMSFLALANALLGNPIQKLFHSDPAVLATELLLQERMPSMAEAEAPEEPFTGLSAAGEDLPVPSLEAEPAH